MNPQEAQRILSEMNAGRVVWDDNLRAQANNALSSGGGGGSFSFDFAEEAKKAYGELGTYYDRILKESRGDMNRALARLQEDYDTGVRIRKEDYGIQQEQIDREQEQNKRIVQGNALARGIYQKSLQDPTGGFGIADENMKLVQEGAERQRQSLGRTLLRATEAADLARKRTTEDVQTGQERSEFDLEQQRRKEAGELANVRGQRSFSDWQMRNAL